MRSCYVFEKHSRITNWVAAEKLEPEQWYAYRGKVFRAPPLAHDSRFALASLSPLFAQNTQNITPVL